MLLLVSDTNVLIDIEDGNLIHVVFKLPYEFAVPDVLFELVQHPLNPLNRWHVFFCRLNFVYHGLHRYVGMVYKV